MYTQTQFLSLALSHARPALFWLSVYLSNVWAEIYQMFIQISEGSASMIWKFIFKVTAKLNIEISANISRARVAKC